MIFTMYILVILPFFFAVYWLLARLGSLHLRSLSSLSQLKYIGAIPAQFLQHETLVAHGRLLIWRTFLCLVSVLIWIPKVLNLGLILWRYHISNSYPIDCSALSMKWSFDILSWKWIEAKVFLNCTDVAFTITLRLASPSLCIIVFIRKWFIRK